MTYQHEKIISLNLQLISAIKAKELQRVQELLAAGADPTKTLELGGITPIAIAAMWGATEVIRTLLQAGAEVDAVTSKVTIPNTSPIQIAIDSTPVILAARCGWAFTVAALLEAGADLYRKDNEGLSAYDWACINNFKSVQNVLCQAELNATNEDNDTILMNVAARCQVQLMQILLDRGAEVNIISKDGYTPLARAAGATHWVWVNDFHEELTEFGRTREYTEQGVRELRPLPEEYILKTIAALLAAGADPNLPNHTTPLIQSVRYGNLKVIQALLNAGARVDIPQKDGYTALDIAQLYRQDKALELLQKN